MAITYVPSAGRAPGFLDRFSQGVQQGSDLLQKREELKLQKEEINLRKKAHDQQIAEFKFQQEQELARIAMDRERLASALQTDKVNRDVATKNQALQASQFAETRHQNQFERSMARRGHILARMQATANIEQSRAQTQAAKDQSAALQFQREQAERDLRFDVAQSVDTRFGTYEELAAQFGSTTASRRTFGTDVPPDRETLIGEEFEQIKSGRFGGMTGEERLTRAVGTFLTDVPEEVRQNVANRGRALLRSNAPPEQIVEEILGMDMEDQEKARLVGMFEFLYGIEAKVPEEVNRFMQFFRSLAHPTSPRAMSDPMGGLSTARSLTGLR